MNAGARQADADYLMFLHADTVLHEAALPTLQATLRRSRPLAGCFTHRFSKADLPLQALSLLHSLRFDVTRVPYGDQVLFIERELFWKLGGFPESPLEDLIFGERLRGATRPVRLRAHAVTDSRKFRLMGTWRSVWYVLCILLDHKLGRPPGASRFFEDIR